MRTCTLWTCVLLVGMPGVLAGCGSGEEPPPAAIPDAVSARQPPAEPPGLPLPPIPPGLAGGKKGEPDASTADRRPPVAPHWQPQAVAVGDTALAIEGVRCHEPDEALVFVERGTVAAVNGDGQVTLTLAERYDAGFDRRRTGTSSIERWCIPRRRVCWEQAGFADWNGTDRPGGTRIYPARSVSRDAADVMAPLVEYAARNFCRISP